MFSRRIPRPIGESVVNAVWPRMGWRRTAAYYWHRLKRIPGSPESIALGFAAGAAASMMPLMGFHFILSAFIALVLRGSIIASAVGTVVGNPWTFPFIWLGTFQLGTVFLGLDGELIGERPFRTMFGGLFTAIQTFDGVLFMEKVWPIWKPMMVGSLPVALLAGLVAYGLLVKPLRAVRRRRSERIGRHLYDVP